MLFALLSSSAAIPQEIPFPSEFQNSVLSQKMKSRGYHLIFFADSTLFPDQKLHKVVDTKFISGRHPKLILTNTKSFQDKFLVNAL